MLAYITLVLGSDDEDGKVRQSRRGANSFSLTGRGREYHFRAEHDGAGGIRVLDQAREGNVIATLTTRNQARDFIKSLVPATVTV